MLPHHPGFKHGAFWLSRRRQAEPLDEAQGQSDSAVSQMSCRYDGNMMAMQWNDMEYVTNIDNWMCSNMQYIDVGQLPTNMKG